MGYLENRTLDEIQTGDSASLSRTLTMKDIQLFAVMSGDISPIHVDEEYARSDTICSTKSSPTVCGAGR
jgi:acyl dehydratase